MSSSPLDPAGAYDPDAVAATARAADPGLPPEEAVSLAREAWGHLQEAGATDAAEIARRLLSGPHATGATPANVVAKAAVDFCQRNGIDPRA